MVHIHCTSEFSDLRMRHSWLQLAALAMEDSVLVVVVVVIKGVVRA
jgi:hypothetical protein